MPGWALEATRSSGVIVFKYRLANCSTGGGERLADPLGRGRGCWLGPIPHPTSHIPSHITTPPTSSWVKSANLVTPCVPVEPAA
eukprot:CAMPEP_0119471222 /NCGR_PEP_ID=MMETSP1344-20130328/3776_1 /TAXON_ID=236787 /ORGANISM="Florenciella parvula, Strain CCMP2471" /LENGTH=83 /DNA_ID=CAMNT_0007503973 /DNA_START=20 /DNA_END=267 /DNA_ORIENTATION=-